MDNSTVALLELVIAKLWNIRDDDDPSIEVLAEMAADGLLHLLEVFRQSIFDAFQDLARFQPIWIQ